LKTSCLFFVVCHLQADEAQGLLSNESSVRVQDSPTSFL